MFQSDSGSKYYKEIPLAEMLAVDTAKGQIGGEYITLVMAGVWFPAKKEMR